MIIKKPLFMTTDVDETGSNSQVMEKLKSRLGEINATLKASEQKSDTEVQHNKKKTEKSFSKSQKCSLVTKLLFVALFVVTLAFSIDKGNNC